MNHSDQLEWVCPVCGREGLRKAGLATVEPGARCPDHPDSVLVAASAFERFEGDQVLGSLVGGKYAVFGVLGMGGFGAVYRAVQEPVGREVALKVVHQQNADHPELRARFFREAKLVARLKDPVVVTLYDYGEEQGLGLYMVFELVEGKTLGQIMKEGPQDPVRVTHILLQLLRALGEAHRRGMVHRDLKPANVMLVENPTGDELVRLLDFGIAKVVTADEQDKSLETQRGLVMGTPRYLSPEQARATGTIDLRSDLYSLGVMGYALLAGSNPFRRESVIETIMAHCTMPPPPIPQELNVPPSLEAALMRSMEKGPDDRFQSAQQMAEALEAAFPHIAFPSGRWYARDGSSLGRSTGAYSGELDMSQPTPSGAGYGSAGAGYGSSGAASMAAVSAGHGTAGYVPESRPFADPMSPGTISEPVEEAPPRAEARKGPILVGAFLAIFVFGTGLGLWLLSPTKAPTVVRAQGIDRRVEAPPLVPPEKAPALPEAPQPEADRAEPSSVAAPEPPAEGEAESELPAKDGWQPADRRRRPSEPKPSKPKLKPKPKPTPAKAPPRRKPAQPAAKPDNGNKRKPADRLEVPEF